MRLAPPTALSERELRFFHTVTLDMLLANREIKAELVASPDTLLALTDFIIP